LRPHPSAARQRENEPRPGLIPIRRDRADRFHRDWWPVEVINIQNISRAELVVGAAGILVRQP